MHIQTEFPGLSEQRFNNLLEVARDSSKDGIVYMKTTDERIFAINGKTISEKKDERSWDAVVKYTAKDGYTGNYSFESIYDAVTRVINFQQDNLAGINQVASTEADLTPNNFVDFESLAFSRDKK